MEAMNIKDDKLLTAIDEILQRGNDVQIQRKKDGYVVLEVNKIIRMSNKCSCIEDEPVVR